jgi:hypothetical protein
VCLGGFVRFHHQCRRFGAAPPQLLLLPLLLPSQLPSLLLLLLQGS